MLIRGGALSSSPYTTRVSGWTGQSFDTQDIILFINIGELEAGKLWPSGTQKTRSNRSSWTCYWVSFGANAANDDSSKIKKEMVCQLLWVRSKWWLRTIKPDHWQPRPITITKQLMTAQRKWVALIEILVVIIHKTAIAIASVIAVVIIVTAIICCCCGCCAGCATGCYKCMSSCFNTKKPNTYTIISESKMVMWKVRNANNRSSDYPQRQSTIDEATGLQITRQTLITQFILVLLFQVR